MTRYATVSPPLDLGGVGPASNQWMNAIGSAFPSANSARMYAFQVARPVTVSAAFFRVQTASGSMDVGIYDAAGVRLASTGSFTVPAQASSCTQALTASVTLVPGRKYWAAIACDNGTAIFGGYAAIQRPNPTGYATSGAVAASMPLPSTIVLPTSEPSSAVAYYLAFA